MTHFSKVARAPIIRQCSKSWIGKRPCAMTTCTHHSDLCRSKFAMQNPSYTQVSKTHFDIHPCAQAHTARQYKQPSDRCGWNLDNSSLVAFTIIINASVYIGQRTKLDRRHILSWRLLQSHNRMAFASCMFFLNVHLDYTPLRGMIRHGFSLVRQSACFTWI